MVLLRTNPGGLFLAIGLAVMTVREARGQAASLYAPYVVFDAGDQVVLELEDRTGAGALVRVRFFDPSGQLLARSGHPLVISRAVPPGEALSVDVGAFWADSFRGSLILEANHALDATLTLPSVRYDLVPAVSSASLALSGAVDGEPWIALHNAGRGAATVVVRGSSTRSVVWTRTCAPSGCLIERLAGVSERDDEIFLESSMPIAGIVLARHGSRMAVVSATGSEMFTPAP